MTIIDNHKHYAKCFLGFVIAGLAMGNTYFYIVDAFKYG